jgi:hypothetical protein
MLPSPGPAQALLVGDYLQSPPPQFSRGVHRGVHAASIDGTHDLHDLPIHAGFRMSRRVGMGGTGLEPVTPSLSTRSSVRVGSLLFAQSAWLSRNSRRTNA